MGDELNNVFKCDNLTQQFCSECGAVSDVKRDDLLEVQIPVTLVPQLLQDCSKSNVRCTENRYCSLKESFDGYFTQTLIEAWDCPNSCSPSGKKWMHAALGDMLAPYLVVQFRRFRSGESISKISGYIHFDATVDVGVYQGSSAGLVGVEESTTAESRLYSLSSVVVHEGKYVDSGHYYSYVRTGGVWYKCDDNSVVRVDSAEGMLGGDGCCLHAAPVDCGFVRVYSVQAGGLSPVL